MRILSAYAFPASRHNVERTTVVRLSPRWLRHHYRLRSMYTAFAMLRQRSKFDVAVALGDLVGLFFGGLQRLVPGRHLPTVLVECNWYREPRLWRRPLKKFQMRFCLSGVDRCVVWAEREIKAYASEFHQDDAKFVFIPQHIALHPDRYRFTVREGDYIFAAGNYDRDFRTFVAAVRDITQPCIIACTVEESIRGIELPSHVRHVRATPEEFRELMAGALIVVVPMEKGHLHSGGQQGIVNGMALGKPVVVTDPEGASSYIRNGETGILVPAADPNALRQALLELLADPERRRRIGERARLSVQGFTVENIYDRVCSLAVDIAKARKRYA